jgi:hypothetical protein
VTGGEVAAAVLQRNAIAAMMSVVARVIAPVHIILSLLCGEQKRHNPINVKFCEIIANNLYAWVQRRAISAIFHTAT